jgi:hypothetical protein
MNRISRHFLAAAVGACLAVTAVAPAQVAPDRLARLGTDLTPVGAERAGNADGTIPAWTGGLPVAAIDQAVGYTDPFAAEIPLFRITAANVEQYKGLLSSGHLALFKRDPKSFWMNVYPTHRTAAYPEAVLAEVKNQAPLARTQGDHILDVGRTTVPFPVPADGVQVMWNHVYRWRGGSVERRVMFAPVQGNGSFYVARLYQNVVFDQQGYMEKPLPGRLYTSGLFFYAPPSAIGLRNITWEPTDPVSGDRARWAYIPQTLDTRRLPSYDYDTLEPYSGGLRTADQTDGWNGAPDRYEWKLVGKRELLIGYNSFRLADRNLPYAAILRPHGVDPDLLRYERHRVWVVEATLKPGKRHRYFKRIFYVDEDTWQVAQEEIYNEKGQLFRFGDHQEMQFYDVSVPWYAATIHHNLATGAYLVYGLSNKEPGPWRWGFKGKNSDYMPSNLRGIGQR